MDRDDEFNQYLAERAFGGVADGRPFGMRSPEAIEIQRGNGGPDRLASVDESLLVSPILTDYVGMTGAKSQGRLCGGIEEEDDDHQADIVLNDASSILSRSSFASIRGSSDGVETDQKLGSDLEDSTLKQMEEDPERSSPPVDTNNANDPSPSAAKLLLLDTSQCPSLGLGSVGSTDSVEGDRYDGKSPAGAQHDGGECSIENGVGMDETTGSIRVLPHFVAVGIDAPCTGTASGERNSPENPIKADVPERQEKGEEAEEPTNRGTSLLVHIASAPRNHDLPVGHYTTVQGQMDGSTFSMRGKKEDADRSCESFRDEGMDESDEFDDPEVSFLIGVTGSGEEAISDIDPDDSDTVPIVLRESSEISFENDEECSEGLVDSPPVKKVATPSSSADPSPQTNTPTEMIPNGGVAIAVEIVADVEDANCAPRAEVDGDYPHYTKKGSIDGVFRKECQSQKKIDDVRSLLLSVVPEPMQDRHEVEGRELSPGNEENNRDSRLASCTRHASNKLDPSEVDADAVGVATIASTLPSFPENERTADTHILIKEEKKDFDVQVDNMEGFNSVGRKSPTSSASEPRTQLSIDSNSAAVALVNETQETKSPMVPTLSDPDSLETRKSGSASNGGTCQTPPNGQETAHCEASPAHPDPPSANVPRSSNHDDQSFTPEKIYRVANSALKNERHSHDHASPKTMIETPANDRHEAQDESVPLQSGSHIDSGNLLSLSLSDERSSGCNDDLSPRDKFSRIKAIPMNNILNSEATSPQGEVFPSPPHDQSAASPVKSQIPLESGTLSRSTSDGRRRNSTGIGLSVLSPPLQSFVSKPVHDLSSARKKVDATSSALVERLRGAAERRKLLVSRSRNSLVAKEQEHSRFSENPATNGDAEAEQSFEVPPVPERKIPSKTKLLIPTEDTYQPFKARPLPITTGEMGCGGQTGVPKVAKRPATVPSSPILGLRRSNNVVSKNVRFSTNKGKRSSNVAKGTERSRPSRHQDVLKPPSKTIPVVKEKALRAEPFRRVLAGNEASQAKEMALREKRLQEEVEARKLASFRARPLPRASIIKPPSASSPPLLGLDLLDDISRKENKYPSAAHTPAHAVQKSTSTDRELHSTRRAKSRACFDAQRAVNEQDRSRRRHKQRKRLMLKTEAQLKELRKCLR